MSSVLSCPGFRHHLPFLSESRAHFKQAANWSDARRNSCTVNIGPWSRYDPRLLLLSFHLSFLLDIVIGALHGSNIEAINKARNIVNNAVVQELEQEDSSRSGIYENVLRRHIISHCQHLRVCLFTVETLMSIYNEHVAKQDTDVAPKWHRFYTIPV